MFKLFFSILLISSILFSANINAKEPKPVFLQFSFSALSAFPDPFNVYAGVVLPNRFSLEAGIGTQIFGLFGKGDRSVVVRGGIPFVLKNKPERLMLLLSPKVGYRNILQGKSTYRGYVEEDNCTNDYFETHSHNINTVLSLDLLLYGKKNRIRRRAFLVQVTAGIYA